ncbi:relaxase/mobilization nuclease domain-containing protein [Pedobacter polaris]
MDQNKGELMKIENFGPLLGLDNLRPEDYSNYLKLVSAQNTRIKAPQFHAAISCKGKEYNKEQLTEIATSWLKEMGYAKNPYLIVFHKDTENNHVHIVSTRVDKEGKKISSEFEKIKAVQNINKVMGIDEGINASQDVEKALTYQFSTKAQFMMILESRGYVLKQNERNIEVIKFGKKQLDINLVSINDKSLSFEKDTNRIAQMRAIFEKYKLVYNTDLSAKTMLLAGGLKKNTDTYTSDLSEFLKEKFGIELIYHGKDGKQPYGYSIIDHAEKNVFKGGDVISLKELLNYSTANKVYEPKNQRIKTNDNKTNITSKLSEEQVNYYATLLKASLYNYPTLLQGLSSQSLVITKKYNELFLNDVIAGVEVPILEILETDDYRNLTQSYFGNENLPVESLEINHSAPIAQIHLADDQDDAARKKKRKS